MSDICPTVRIKTDNKDGFMNINKSDYREGEHKLFIPAGEKKKAEVAKKVSNKG